VRPQSGDGAFGLSSYFTDNADWIARKSKAGVDAALATRSKLPFGFFSERLIIVIVII